LAAVVLVGLLNFSGAKCTGRCAAEAVSMLQCCKMQRWNGDLAGLCGSTAARCISG